MKKTTINHILMGIIVVLCISICFLIFCIAKRPRYIETAGTAEPQSAADTDSVKLPEPESTAQTEPSTAPMQGKTSTRVNIRDRASEDAKVLETVEEGTTFEIIEVLENGWTHILYQDMDAYISSAYVIIINQ